MKGRFMTMIRKFNRDYMKSQVLEGLSKLVGKPLTLNDVGMEATRLNYDELDLQLIPENIQKSLPLWVIVYDFSIDGFFAYAVVDDEQHQLFVIGVMQNGDLLCYL